MHKIYNEDYYLNYDVGSRTVNYMEAEETAVFLRNMAKKIYDDLHPKTVLDAGCATGHLVAALRDLGVEAYGVDISDYAISMVREDVRPYCAVGSLAEPLPSTLPQTYDLVVTIEVLEHLTEADGKKAIQNLCKYSDRILFSSTPDDLEDPTHIHVRPREYWAALFAEAGFADDLGCRPTYLTEYASCFQRCANWMAQLEAYEQHITQTDQQIRQLPLLNAQIQTQDAQIQALNAQTQAQDAQIQTQDAQIQALNAQTQAQDAQICALEAQVQDQDTQILMLNAQIQEKQQQLAAAAAELDKALRSRSWRITKPLRGVTTWIRTHRWAYLIAKGIQSLFRDGLSKTWPTVKRKLRKIFQNKKLANKPLYTNAELEAQRNTAFPKDIRFSILVPLYNTPKKFLREMIQSVLDQTYGGWELCLADGSDAEHTDLEKICTDYARRDSRIRYQKLEKNLGISGNTNACIDMSTGDYIALFDHDDLLHPAALFEMMRAICEQNADFIYTDETTFHNTPSDAFCPHFKPDYAPDTLRSYNYICHFTAFSRQLLEKTGGGFRSEFDGSQDYDLILRLTEQAESIVHIPKILYYWRSHPNSVASGVAAKPYTMDAAKRALAQHLSRIGLKGEVLDSKAPTTYQIAYEITGNPCISILIPNKDHVPDLKKCLDSIMEKSTYPNWEIIVIENNSVDKETFAYYREIQKDSRIQVVTWSGVFNYSAINHFGAQYAHGEYLLLLNNDVEIITPDWLEQMLMFAQRKDVGGVGAMLYYPDDTVQHAGVILGIGGVAGHSHKYFPRNHSGYMSRMQIAQNYSCVTAACMMIRRDVWDEIHGLDETFAVAFNDVDLCMRIRKAGYLIVWTPFAELYHYESKSRGLEDTPEKQERFRGEVERFQTRWAKELAAGDPYYNPNFTLTREDFSLRE